MSQSSESNLRAEAWRPVEGGGGWLVLMDATTGFRSPRLVLSEQDSFFLTESAKGLFPRDKFKVITDNNKRFLVRLPAS
jgi:hypothetical protein